MSVFLIELMHRIEIFASMFDRWCFLLLFESSQMVWQEKTCWTGKAYPCRLIDCFRCAVYCNSMGC